MTQERIGLIMSKLKTVSVTAYPYATQYGTIEVPAALDGDKLEQYIACHWDDIVFGEPDLDYCGTDYEIYDEEEEKSRYVEG